MSDSNHSNPLIDSDIEDDFRVVMQLDDKPSQGEAGRMDLLDDLVETKSLGSDEDVPQLV